MLDRRLRTVCEFIDSWCNKHNITYSIVCDESDLQGMLVLRKYQPAINGLLVDLQNIIAAEGICLDTTKVRGGVILALSIKALSESQLANVIAKAREEIIPMSFNEKVTSALALTTANTPKEPELVESTFLDSAMRLVGEAQYKTASRGITRANQTSLQRQRVGSDNTLGGPQTSPLASDTKATQASKGPETRFENKIANTFEVDYKPNPPKFNKQLSEALDGMATPSGIQPNDLFAKFAKALQVLGQVMGTGPLQDQLKQQGINWKKSDDGQAVILYVVNAETKAPQPIARISAATLEKPSDFETQLLNIMDFAKNDAPGTFKQRQEELQNQQKAAREIAKQLGPQDQNAVATQMGSSQPQQMAAPQTTEPIQQPAPVQPAAQTAAQEAATPKQPMQQPVV